MDTSQINSFLDYLVGWRDTGQSAGDDALCVSYNPAMRAFLLGCMGQATPNNVDQLRHIQDGRNDVKRRAMASLLHSVAAYLET